MTALSRRQALVGAAAAAVAAALPEVAEAEPRFIETLVKDSIEDDAEYAWALYDGGPHPPFPIPTVNLAPLLREFRERLRTDYGIGS